MRSIQVVAVALLTLGSATAALTFWLIIVPPAEPARLSGPAPVLIGDAPPPATATPGRPLGSPAVPVETTTPVARNLAPATAPSPPEPTRTEPARESGSARGATGKQQGGPESPGPAAIQIPRIDVVASVVAVGLNERGEMASPRSYVEVGWWRYGASPGDYGRAVLAGHIDSPTAEAVFYKLDLLAPGDEIVIVLDDESGTELRFVVRGAALYHVDHAPVDQIFGSSNERELILITCGGTFDRDSGEYLYRRVVFARLAPESSAAFAD